MSRNSIETSPGNYIDVFDITPESLLLDDVAQGLATNTRWGGFYNLELTDDRIYVVAQHGVYVSEMIEERWPEDIEAQLTGLHHDDSEGLIKDFPTPIKRNLPWYMELEVKVQGPCYDKFVGPISALSMDRMHWADQQLLELEGRYFGKTYLGPGTKLFTDWAKGDKVWTPSEAKRKFLARHALLTEKLAA